MKKSIGNLLGGSKGPVRGKEVPTQPGPPPEPTSGDDDVATTRHVDDWALDEDPSEPPPGEPTALPSAAEPRAGQGALSASRGKAGLLQATPDRIAAARADAEALLRSGQASPDTRAEIEAFLLASGPATDVQAPGLEDPGAESPAAGVAPGTPLSKVPGKLRKFL